ncbi:response regulator [Sulfitobacter sp. SK011]|uniref:response regulator n=1 Tax=Sulfitobacter sp. SK011 TaxID=1389004 RepID=UPI000E0B5180|nr:response regulator [Sulfitobacter sp. SK011]AXI41168.1 two-component system response regulator [Sulfitobacter sp. SK011]
MHKRTREAKFLIVDDDKVSVMAMQRAMRKLKIVNDTEICVDGQDALDFLQNSSMQSAGLPPYIVMLDLNMPRMGGLEFLDAIRADPALSKVVVFVFTTSDTPDDVRSAYSRNIAGYIVKENPSETFAIALDMLETYGRIVELPV